MASSAVLCIARIRSISRLDLSRVLPGGSSACDHRELDVLVSAGRIDTHQFRVAGDSCCQPAFRADDVAVDNRVAFAWRHQISHPMRAVSRNARALGLLRPVAVPNDHIAARLLPSLPT